MGLIDMLLQKFISLLSFDPPEDKTEARHNTGVQLDSAVAEKELSEFGQDARSAGQRIKDRRKGPAQVGCSQNDLKASNQGQDSVSAALCLPVSLETRLRFLLIFLPPRHHLRFLLLPARQAETK